MSKKNPDALTKNDLAKVLNREIGLTHLVATDAVNALFDAIADALVAGKHCEFRDFGVFTTTLHKPRIGRNPKKPEQTYAVPGRRAVRFRPGKRFREGLRAEPAPAR